MRKFCHQETLNNSNWNLNRFGTCKRIHQKKILGNTTKEKTLDWIITKKEKSDNFMR